MALFRLQALMRHFRFFAAAQLACLLIAGEQDALNQSSPVQRRIAVAQKRIQADPKSSQSYNDLAFALCRRARDNGDVRLYDQAEAALERSSQLSPGNYDAAKLHVSVLLGKHEFAEALKLAADLNNRVHDDIGVWGLLVDAHSALGNYADAERAAQWILDLRGGSSLGFEKAAGLREIFGDFEGAIEFFDEANRRTSPSDADERAWLLTQSARIQLVSGNLNQADELLKQALKFFPDSQLALAVRAKVRMAQGDYREAASLLDQRYRTVQTLSNLYEWAEALEKSRQKEQADAAFQDFETKARSESTKPYNANRELIFFYTDHKNKPAEALTLAAQESGIRHDSATLDAYAWALYHNQRYVDAKKQMDRALAVGVRDPVYFCHAAQIATKANDPESASRFERELASLGANSCPAGQPVQSAREITR